MRDVKSVKIGIISVFVDYHRRGQHKRGVLQPQAAPFIAGCLPDDAHIEIVNDSWTDPDFSKRYDLLFISTLHPDFDRARQLSHYWRKRGARTVLGGNMASAFPRLCLPFFDAVAVGDAETTVPRIFDDFLRDRLQPVYVSTPYEAAKVPAPRFDLMAHAQAFPLALEASRGCKFACSFCVLTGLGVRYANRPPESVVGDIQTARRQTRGATRWWEWQKRKAVVFYDNNLGADKEWLGALANALKPLGLYWGGPITFDALQDEALMQRCADSGCLSLYAGLETFNPEALADMNKSHNVIGEVRKVVDHCNRLGIMVDAGLLLNPAIDTPDYVARIPRLLAQSGLYIPTFVAFESPIPGTPHFRRLASLPEPALLPNALLRDFTGYTLVTRPQRASVQEFTAAYRALCNELCTRKARFRKLAHDLPRLLARGHVPTAIADFIDHWLDVPDYRPDADRSLVAGTDREPPEQHRIPFESSDFESEAERKFICEPWRVTDAHGRVFPQWLDSRPVFGAGGKVRAVAARILDRQQPQETRLQPAET
jgi:hypothetical protein